MSEKETLFCPQCKQTLPKINFEQLPLDLRCRNCIPTQVAAVLYDERVKQAGQKLAQIFDGVESSKNLRPVERMIEGVYEAWGGPAIYCQDLVEYIKALTTGPKKNYSAAVTAMGKLLALHAKVDRMKMEDDWKHMEEEQIRDRLKVKLAQLAAEVAFGEQKPEILKGLMGGND